MLNDGSTLICVLIRHIVEADADIAIEENGFFLRFQRQFFQFHQTFARSHAVHEDGQESGSIEHRALDAVDELGECHEHAHCDESCLQLEQSPYQCQEESAYKADVDQCLRENGKASPCFDLLVQETLPLFQLVHHGRFTSQHLDNHLVLDAFLNDGLDGGVAVLDGAHDAAHPFEVDAREDDKDG